MPDTIQWWIIENSPFIEGYAEMLYDDTPGDSGQVEWTPKADALPPEVRQRLVHLVTEEFDSGRCEAADCWGGPNPAHLGFGLSGPADEHTSWTWTTLVLIPADIDNPEPQALAVCESCCPSTTYARRSDR